MYGDIAIDGVFRGLGLDWTASPDAFLEAARAQRGGVGPDDIPGYAAAFDFAQRHWAADWAELIAPEEDVEDSSELDGDLLFDDPEVDPPEAWESAPTQVIHRPLIERAPWLAALVLACGVLRLLVSAQISD